MCNKLICKLLDKIIKTEAPDLINDEELYNTCIPFYLSSACTVTIYYDEEEFDCVDNFMFGNNKFDFWDLPDCEEKDMLINIRSVSDAIEFKKEICRDLKGNVEKSG
jgi:hypothetical protein